MKKRMYGLFCVGLFAASVCLVAGGATLNSLKSQIVPEKSTIKDNKINRKQFAMYLEDENGEYQEYTDSEMFPINGILNLEESFCVDNKDNIISSVLIQNENGSVTVTSSKTLYCTLYFDKDPLPLPFTFYLGGSSNPEYVNNRNTSVYLSWEDSDISYYCVTNEQSSDTCNFTEVIGNSVEGTYELTDGDGEKEVYAYIKDKYDGISPIVSDTIILDTVPPTVTGSAVNNNTISPYISIKSNELGTYCINTTSTRTNFSNCVKSGNVTTTSSFNSSAITNSGTYYIHVKDNAGNIGVSDKIEIKIGNPFGQYLLDNKPTGLVTNTQYGGMYRFQGTTNVNNYVCFGNDGSCVGKNNYIYRVIGVTEDGEVKIIKSTSLGSYAWSTSSGATWLNATVNKNTLNGTTFYKSTTYMGSNLSWQSKIAEHAWWYGDTVSNFNYNGTTAYNTESTWNTQTASSSNKIALMYIHDYLLAYSGGNPSNYTNAAKSWIFSGNMEWILPRLYTTQAILLMNNGQILNSLVDISMATTLAIRPVFYLKADVNYISGTGTSTDPFIIS